jgi:hypothetical protein
MAFVYSVVRRTAGRMKIMTALNAEKAGSR